MKIIIIFFHNLEVTMFHIGCYFLKNMVFHYLEVHVIMGQIHLKYMKFNNAIVRTTQSQKFKLTKIVYFNITLSCVDSIM